MKFIDISAIESALVRRFVLFLHLPLSFLVMALGVVEGLFRATQSFVATNVNHIGNYFTNVLASVSTFFQDLHANITGNIRNVLVAIKKVWYGKTVQQAAAAVEPPKA